MCFISKHLSVTKAAFYIPESVLECCENTENSLECFVKTYRQNSLSRHTPHMYIRHTPYLANPASRHTQQKRFPKSDSDRTPSLRRHSRLSPTICVGPFVLNSTEPDDDSLKQVPDKRFYLAMDFNQVDNFHFHHPGLYPLNSVIQGKHLYSPQINHISFSSTAVPPLTQMKDIDEVGTVALCVWFLFSSAVLRYGQMSAR